MAERQLLGSFARMLPELLRYSSASALLAKIPDAQQAYHRHDGEEEGAGAATGAPARTQKAKAADPWAGWGDAVEGPAVADDDGDAADAGALDDDALAALGL